jgi:uroporphyrinogen decarboxylase
LDVITRVFTEYALACLEAGASGIYFATTGWASRDVLREDEYRTFGLPYDLRLLEAIAAKAPFHVLHNCGSNIHFDLLAEYPVSAISWAATLPGNPTLGEGMGRTRKAVMGGVSEKTTLVDGKPEDVAAEVTRAIEQTGGRRVLIGPGCSIPPRTPRANLEAAAAAARSKQNR